MDRIIINVVDKKAEYVKRIVLDVKATLTNCDFVTIGDELMFDKDSDFLTFGYDVTGRMNQLAIVTGEGHGKSGKELYDAILTSVKGFEKVSEDENQIWLRET
jgi:PII-like signaling protein